MTDDRPSITTKLAIEEELAAPPITLRVKVSLSEMKLVLLLPTNSTYALCTICLTKIGVSYTVYNDQA